MITASKNLIALIQTQESKPKLAERLGIDLSYLYKIMEGVGISHDLADKIRRVTGMATDKAFIIVDEKPEEGWA